VRKAFFADLIIALTSDILRIDVEKGLRRVISAHCRQDVTIINHDVLKGLVNFLENFQRVMIGSEVIRSVVPPYG
jgi:hypothetical protein